MRRKTCLVDGRRVPRISQQAAIYGWRSGDLELRIMVSLLDSPQTVATLEVSMLDRIEDIAGICGDLREIDLLGMHLGSYHLTKAGRMVLEKRQTGRREAAHRVVADHAPSKLARLQKRFRRAGADESTAFRGQHSELEERNVTLHGKKGLIVQAPIDRLYRRRSLTTRQHVAGGQFSQDWELGIAGARDPEAQRGHSGPSGGGISDAQLHATSAYLAAVKRLGSLASVVEGVVLYERTLEEIGDRLRQKPAELLGILKAGLDVLGDAYGLSKDVVEEMVRCGKKKVRLVYRIAPDGMCSALTLGIKRWTVTAPDDISLVRAARRSIRDAERRKDSRRRVPTAPASPACQA